MFIQGCFSINKICFAKDKKDYSKRCMERHDSLLNEYNDYEDNSQNYNSKKCECEKKYLEIEGKFFAKVNFEEKDNEEIRPCGCNRPQIRSCNCGCHKNGSIFNW